MSGRHDLIVVGAGPAGTAAAIEATTRGLDTLLIDEAPTAGGQVYRAPAPGIQDRHEGADHQAGAVLRAALAASGVTCAFAHRVWLIEHGFAVHALGPDGPMTARSEALILATGAIERFVPIPGWTLPGVIGLAGATVLLKSQAMLPGRRVVVAGSGPLLALVAAGILNAGGEVAAVVDAAPRAAWLSRLPALLSRPDLAARGAGWIARLMASRVPILSGHALSRIAGSDGVDRAFVVPLGRTGAVPREIACDAVCYGHGLLPCTEATRLLGATHDFDPALGGWAPRIDPDQRTNLPLLYAAGDGAGVLGAEAAPLLGRLAALAALHDLGRLDRAGWQSAAAPLHRQRARASRFGRAMATLVQPTARTMALVTPETIVCRCEGVVRARLDEAIEAGAVTMNDLKAATRCGMGPCGGRVCADAAATLIAAGTGRPRATIAEPTARPPLRPVPFAALAGDFQYDDLPIPAPAPL